MKILTKSEKKELVIKLYKDEKTYKEIAKMVRISPRDIGKIIKEYTGEKTVFYTKPITSKAYSLLLKGKSPTQVAIKLDLNYEDIRRIYSQYLSFQEMRSVETIYTNYKDYLPRILQIIDSLKNGEITIEEFVEFCKYVQDIPTLEHRRDELQHKVNILSLKTDPS